MFVKITDEIILNTNWITNICYSLRDKAWYVEFIRYFHGQDTVTTWSYEKCRISKKMVDQILKGEIK